MFPHGIRVPNLSTRQDAQSTTCAKTCTGPTPTLSPPHSPRPLNSPPPRESLNKEGTEDNGEEKDQSDRMARELMERTALEPAPPPSENLLPAEDKSFASRVDAGSALGGMITPRPAEQNPSREEHAGAGVT